MTSAIAPDNEPDDVRLREALRLVAVQLAWAAGVLLLGHVLTRRGRRVLEVQGG